MKLVICVVALLAVHLAASYDPAQNSTFALCGASEFFRFKNPDDILTLETPNYPGNYETGVSCRAFINLGALKNTEYFLQIQTTVAVDMEPRTIHPKSGNMRCINEYVKFRTVLVPGSSAPLKFKKVCDADTLLAGNVLYSTKKRLAIDFDTDNDATIGTGAQFTITAHTRTIFNHTICGDAGNIFTFTDPLQELIIFSPNYPAQYPNDDACTTQVNLGDLHALGYVLEINTVEPLNMQGRIDVNGKQKCALDFFKFKGVRRPGKTATSGIKACGTDDISGDNAMISTLATQAIVYKTDSTVQGDAFRLRITPIIPEDL